MVVYLQASRVATDTQGITMPTLSILTVVTFEKVYFRQRSYAMLLAKLEQAQAKGYPAQTSTHDVHLLA